MATSKSPQFSAKGATEWARLIADLKSVTAGGTNQSTAGDKLKARFTKIEIGIKDAPAREVNEELRRLNKALTAKMAALEGKKDSKENEALRKSLRDDLKLMERSILKTSMTATGTIGRQLLQSQRLKEKDAAKKFKADTKENYKGIQATLAKQLLDVTESRGISDSEQLQRLQGDLAEALRALKSDDFEHYSDLSNRLGDVSRNYGVDNDTASRLESIQNLVQDQAQRKEAKHDRIQNRLGYVGLGGLYGKGRSVAGGVAKWSGRARTAKNFIKNTLAGGHSRVRAKAAAVAAASERVNRAQEGDVASVGSQAKDQVEEALYSRQVKALEEISKSTRRKGSTSSGTAGGAGAGLSGALKDLWDKVGGGMGKLGGAAMLLGKLGLVGAAAWAGWSLGGVIYDKYSNEINDAIETVVGVVQKSIEFASKGLQWMVDFIASPVKKIREIGGRLKDMWDNSTFAKFFSSPSEIGAQGAKALIMAKDGKAPATGSPAGAAALASVAEKLKASGTNTSANTSSLLKPAASLGDSSFEFNSSRVSYPVSRGSGASSSAQTAGTSSFVSGVEVGNAGLVSPSGFSGYGGKSNSVPWRATADPIADSVPTALKPASQEYRQPASQGTPDADVQGPGSKGSASSIPTFSYLDNGFFMMNAGVIG